MNRERIAGWGLAAAAAACWSVPGLAKDAPKPSLSIDPIVARNLLAPIEEANSSLVGYRLDRGPEPASGQRARLSIEVGASTLFAITGRLERQANPTGPLDPSHARALGQRRPDSGKVYGGGIARNFSGVDVGATYQYSKLRDGQPEDETQARDNGPGRSHSVRATARVRFRP